MGHEEPIGQEELRFDDKGVSAVLETAADEFVSYTTHQELVEAAERAGIPVEFVDNAIESYLNINSKPGQRRPQGELERTARESYVLGAALGGVGVGAAIDVLVYVAGLSNPTLYHSLREFSSMAVLIILTTGLMGAGFGIVADGASYLISCYRTKKK